MALPDHRAAEATLRECLWVAQNALGQIKQGAPSAYWRGLAEEALEQIADALDDNQAQEGNDG